MQAASQLQPDALAGTIVLGVRWNRSDEERGRAAALTADLDAICELRDGQGRLLDRVGPGRLRNDNGSVVHTGDSRTGAGPWDDERVYVFLDALPRAVHSLVFLIESSRGTAFSEVANASCHVSDHATDDTLLTLPLSPLGAMTRCDVATLQRATSGWRLMPASRPG